MWSLIRLLLEEQSDLGPNCLQQRHLKWTPIRKVEILLCQFLISSYRYPYLTALRNGMDDIHANASKIYLYGLFTQQTLMNGKHV